MSREGRIAILEGLLERIRRNASRPRTAAAAPVAPRESDGDGAPVEGVAGGDDIDDLLDAPMQGFGEEEPRSQMETMAVDEIEDLDMEDDLVEITDAEDDAPELEVSPPAGLDVDIDFDDEEEEVEERAVDEEEPPASSRRAKVLPSEPAESMDAALAAAAEADDRQVPLHTPPPESGQQVAAPQVPEHAPLPEITGIEFGRSEAATAEDAQRPPMPTMEQLGETVELEGADAPDAALELAAQPEPAFDRPTDELEAAIPAGPTAAEYDSTLEPPPEARDELERHIARTGAPAAAEPEPPTKQAAEAAGERTPAEPAAPAVVERPPVAEVEAAHFAPREPAELPRTFLEMLDESLALLSD